MSWCEPTQTVDILFSRFILCTHIVHTFVHRQACSLMWFRPLGHENIAGVSRGHTLLWMEAGWQRPTANTFTKWLAQLRVGWSCPVNRLWWRDMSWSQLEAAPMLLPEIYFPCVLFGKQVGKYNKLGLFISKNPQGIFWSHSIKMVSLLLNSLTDLTVCLWVKASAAQFALGYLTEE